MPPTKDVEPPKPEHPQFRNEHGKRLSARRDARDLLWHRLDGRQLGGYRFHRDLSIPPIEVDFVCLGRKLIVEVINDEQPDETRIRSLEEAGYQTAVFHEQEVLQKTEAVLKVILGVLAERGRR